MAFWGSNLLGSAGREMFNATQNFNPQAAASAGYQVDPSWNVSAPSSSGGGGGGGGGGQDPHINPSTGVWDDNYFAQQQSGWQDARAAEEARAKAELEAAMLVYNQSIEEANAQKGEAEKDRSRLEADYEMQRGKAQTQATQSKEEAETVTGKERSRALSTAKDVESKNRNIARALGILSSSAGGSMLAKPYEQFQQVSADLGQALTTRLGKIDTWLRERGQEIDKAIVDLNSQYTSIVDKINRDIRFTGEQKASAVQQANAALRQSLADLNLRQQAEQNAARQYTSQMLQNIAQMQMYQNPQADVSGILSSAIGAVNPGYNPQSLGIYQTDEQRKKALGYQV